MKNLLFIFLILSGFSCNPYDTYYYTHYHIIASYDPASSGLLANVQIVFVPQQEYRDSIILQLNEHLSIHSLTAQELRYYEFNAGRLVLYIEEPVMPGDQLHISMNYSGIIGDGLIPALAWYPLIPDIEKLTYSVELELPEPYSLDNSWDNKGQRWKLQSEPI